MSIKSEFYCIFLIISFSAINVFGEVKNIEGNVKIIKDIKIVSNDWSSPASIITVESTFGGEKEVSKQKVFCRLLGGHELDRDIVLKKGVKLDFLSASTSFFSNIELSYSRQNGDDIKFTFDCGYWHKKLGSWRSMSFDIPTYRSLAGEYFDFSGLTEKAPIILD